MRASQSSTRVGSEKLRTIGGNNQEIFRFHFISQKDTDREGDVDNDEELETALPNLMDLNFYFEQASVGLSSEEMFKVWLSLKTLVDSKPLQTARFWGKKLSPPSIFHFKLKMYWWIFISLVVEIFDYSDPKNYRVHCCSFLNFKMWLIPVKRQHLQGEVFLLVGSGKSSLKTTVTSFSNSSKNWYMRLTCVFLAR